jgi:hypothetical protein
MGALAKAHKEQTDMLLQKMDGMQQDINMLKSQPAGSKPLSKSAADSKQTDQPGGEEINPVIGQDGKVDNAATAIKKSLTGGGKNLFHNTGK